MTFPTSLPLSPTQIFKGLPRQLYHDYKTTTLDSLRDTAPLEHRPALDSLLTPLTSLALHSISRQNKSARIPPDLFRLHLQRKLRLPLLPPLLQGSKCSCGKPLDPWGDHLFGCHTFNKSTLHDAIRDTLYFLCHKIAPLAHFVRSKHDVRLEPSALLPDYHRNVRPADVGLLLAPPFLSPTLPNHTYLAIDVTIPPPPTVSPAPPGLPTPLQPTLLASKAHLTSIRNKFVVDRAPHLNSQGIFLLPFTVDHLGGLGPFAHAFLYPTSSPIPSVGPAPQWDPHDFRNPDHFQLYSHSLQGPRHLLSHANSQWSKSHSDGHAPRFGSTYHSHTPTQWSTQLLSLNLSIALASHLQTGLSILSTTALQRKHNRRHPPFQGHTLHLPRPPVRTPGPTALDSSDSLTTIHFNSSHLEAVHRLHDPIPDPHPHLDDTS